MAEQIIDIPIGQLRPHPDNPRKDLGDLTELADSIRANGVLQNLTVVPMRPYSEKNDHYLIVIGHRRYAAAKLAGRETLPCVVRRMDKPAQVRTMLMENIQRADLTAYEQAQGFQMMLDLGDSVEEIAQKSGFSRSTVRRRVKLLELDQKKFKKAEARGATLSDYAKLDQISDPELKNEVLDAIGTNNFNMKLKSAIEKEARNQYIKDAAAILETFAQRVTEMDHNRMEYVRNYASWRGKELPEKPENADSAKYYYKVDESTSYADITLYREKAAPTSEENAAAEEAARRKRETDRRLDALKDATGRAHQLRADFIRGYSQEKKHLTEILIFAGKLLADGEWGRVVDEKELAELLGIAPEGKDDSLPMDAYSEKIAEHPEHTFLATVYTMKENVRDGYYQSKWDSEKREWVVGRYANPNLDELYAFMQELGYEMSDEELALQNGTHELFQEDTK